jgi:hypothetical protein
MSIGRALGGVAVVLLCGAFVPIGSCAKGCGRAASSGGDDIARATAVSGARYTDDLARSGAGYGDDLARSGTRYSDEVAVGAGRATDDIALGGALHHGDDLAAAELDLSKLSLTPKQSKAMDKALDVAKDAGQEALGMLADSDEENDDEAKANLDRATKQLDRKLAATLNADQLRQFHATYGSSADVITWLAASQPSAPAKP